MKTKNQEVRDLVSIGDYKRALQICKGWDYQDPTYKDILERGYACLMYPGFYRQLNVDPEMEYQKAVQVLLKVYS